MLIRQSGQATTNADKATKTIHITMKPGVCVGCRICELACSLSQKGIINPQESNILVHITENGEVELEIAQECSCVEGRAHCVELCPVDALQADPGD